MGIVTGSNDKPVSEGHYIMVADLTRVRVAIDVLKETNAGANPHITEKERLFVMRCLYAWKTRLELAVRPDATEKPDEWPLS